MVRGEEGEEGGKEGRRSDNLVRWRLERRRQMSGDMYPATCSLQQRERELTLN